MAFLLYCVAAVVGASPQVPAPNSVETASANLRRERDAIQTREAAEIETLAGRLEKTRQLDPAKQARGFNQRYQPQTPGATRFRPLPEIIAAEPKPTEPWRIELEAIRKKSADALEVLAGKSLKIEPPRYALADECLRSVIDRNPEAASAYRLLGYVPHAGGWATPFAVQQIREGLVLHQVFGWVEKSWTARLDAGELPAPFVAGRPTRWLPTAEADLARREWSKAWQIKTEHFAIRTNVPLAEAITFGNKLEALHDLFLSIAADVIGSELPLAQLSKNPKLAPTVARKRHRVYYFAAKSEYVTQLLPIQGEAVKDSLGTYLPPKVAKRTGEPPTSYFFRDPDAQIDVTSTLYHEASHQLLFETAGGERFDEGRGNFWLFEGLGTYFETLTPLPDGSIEVGGLVGPRIKEARIRLLKAREFVPIGQFCSYNKNIFNGAGGDGDVYLHYTEAIALAVFFMQAKQGAYREGFLDQVRDVYRGRSSRTLEDRLGVSYGALNREFLDYLKAEASTDPR